MLCGEQPTVAQRVVVGDLIARVSLQTLRDVGAKRILRQPVEHEIADLVGAIGKPAIPREGGDLETVFILCLEIGQRSVVIALLLGFVEIRRVEIGLVEILKGGCLTWTVRDLEARLDRRRGSS